MSSSLLTFISFTSISGPFMEPPCGELPVPSPDTLISCTAAEGFKIMSAATPSIALATMLLLSSMPFASPFMKSGIQLS